MKISAKELRLLNYVNTPYGIKRITYLDYDSKSCQSFGAEPIPLTEEWLLKFGFVRHEAFGGTVNMTLHIDENTYLRTNSGLYFMRWSVENPNYEESFNLPISIKSVHQLQNIYFALTGEELTIKD